MKTSKAFLASGWAIVRGGDVARAMGSALASFLFVGSHGEEGGDQARKLGTWRIIAGTRISKIQARRHGTPTGRCSRGHWVTEWSGATPRNAREWNQFGPFAAWFVGASPEEREGYLWTGNPSADANLCRTTPGRGRGRKVRGVPTKQGTLGFSPANGNGCAAHDPKRIAAMMRDRRRQKASREWLAHVNAQRDTINTARNARNEARRTLKTLLTAHQ